MKVLKIIQENNTVSGKLSLQGKQFLSKNCNSEKNYYFHSNFQHKAVFWEQRWNCSTLHIFKIKKLSLYIHTHLIAFIISFSSFSYTCLQKCSKSKEFIFAAAPYHQIWRLIENFLISNFLICNISREQEKIAIFSERKKSILYK